MRFQNDECVISGNADWTLSHMEFEIPSEELGLLFLLCRFTFD